MTGACPPWALAEARGQHERRRKPRHGAPEHREVDARTLSSDRSPVQRAHDLAVSMLPRAQVHHGETEWRRRTIGLAGQVHQSRAGLEHGIVRGLVMFRTKATYPDPDQVWLEARKSGVVDAELRVAPGPLVAREDVDGQRGDQPLKEVAALRLSEVEGDCLLAAVVGEE